MKIRFRFFKWYLDRDLLENLDRAVGLHGLDLCRLKCDHPNDLLDHFLQLVRLLERHLYSHWPEDFLNRLFRFDEVVGVTDLTVDHASLHFVEAKGKVGLVGMQRLPAERSVLTVQPKVVAWDRF